MKINGTTDGGGKSAVIEGLTITSNGTYTAGAGVDGYSPVEVDVPTPEFVTETLSVSANGTYTPSEGIDGYSQVNVNVPATQFVTETLSVSANGTYTPSEGVNGYSQVVVDVPIGGWDQKSLTEGTIEITNIDNSASFVASSAFYNNKNIQTVNLPYATSVGIGAFSSCVSLSQVSLPMCEYVYDSAFQGCNILNSIYLPIVRSIGSVCFNNCRELSSIMLPECIDLYRNAFTGCTMLSTIVLPKLQTVGSNTFRCLNNNPEYTLSLYMGGSDVVTTGSASASTLFFINIQKHIYVRTSLIDMYQQHSIWGQINNVQWFNYEDSPYYTE